MPFCPNCGVEIDSAVEVCPLCKAPLIPRVPHQARIVDELIDAKEKEGLTPDEVRIIIWELISVSAAIIAISVCAIDFLLERRLTWALYPLESLVFLWLLATSWRFLRQRRPLFVTSVMLIIPLFLIAVDMADGGATWSLSIALPISLLVEAAVSISVWLLSNIKGRGSNVLAFVLLLVALLCLGIEATLDIAFGARLAFQWSAIVAFCLLPAAAFFFYLHYRLSKKTTLRRFFHL